MASYDADDVAVRRSAEANFTAFGPARYLLSSASKLFAHFSNTRDLRTSVWVETRSITAFQCANTLTCAGQRIYCSPRMGRRALPTAERE